MSLLSVLQENLLVLLTFREDQAKVIRNTVEPEMFGGFYKTIVVRLYDYIDKYHKPPGEHLPDILIDKLESKNKRERMMYKDIVENIYSANEGMNVEYVMSQLETFVRRQSLRTVAIDLAKALQKDTEESLDEASKLIEDSRNISLKVFDPGTRLSDKKKVIDFLTNTTTSFPTGIRELDKYGLGPTRKEMYLFIADTKKGKTWFEIQLARIAILNRLKVVHITLEMSEEKISKRYFQTLFSIAKRKGKLITIKFKRDKLNNIKDFDELEFTPKITFSDSDIKKKLSHLIDKWGSRILKHIFVKEFPTGGLNVRQLEAYLDNLEMSEQFVPDEIIVDYPDIMETDKVELRHSLDKIFKDLRGLAVRRNAALIVVSQGNRTGATAKTMKGIHIGEDYRKLQHCDVGITYSQTDQEKKLGLARLTVVVARNDQDGLTIVVSQRYATGQFVVDSNLMTSKYWDYVGIADDEIESEDD